MKRTLLAVIGQADEALQLRRHRQQRGERSCRRAGACSCSAMREAQIGNEGKRMRRIDRQRRQHRENLLAELLVEPVAVGVGRSRRLRSPRCRPRAIRARSSAQIRCWSAISSRAISSTWASCCGGRQAVGAERGDAGIDHALQAGHAHHVEFVEVGSRNRKKPQPLEQRMAAVLRLLQHPAVEGQPGQSRD